MIWPLVVATGALTGLSLGLFGSGGSVLTVPILIYVLGYETKAAIAMSLAIVGLTALAGTVQQWRRGSLCLKAALFFSIVGIPGTLGGAWVALRVPDKIQLLLFGFLLLSVALAMLRWQDRPPATGRDECDMRPQLAVGLGSGVGFLTGLLGVGGGFMIVPTLNTLGKLKLRLAIGTSTLIVTVNSMAGVAAYMGQRVAFDWPAVFVFVAASSLAALLGVALSHRWRVETLRKGFAIFLLLLGAGIMTKNIFYD